MTQAQRDTVNAANAKYLAAGERVDAESTNMEQAQSLFEQAQDDLTNGAPVRAAKVMQDAKDALARAEGAKDTQFQITSAAFAALDQAQLDLENAIRASRQTGAVESSGAAK